MSDFFEIWEHFKQAIVSVGDAIAANWEAFLTIAVIYTGIIFLLFSLYFKAKRMYLNDLSESLKIRKEDIERKEKIFNEKSEKYKQMEEELSSQEYQAFLLSKNLHKRDLDDSKLFQPK